VLQSFLYSTASSLKKPQVVSVDVGEFVTTHKLWKLTLFYWFLTCTFHFYCTQMNQTPSYFLGQQRRQTKR